VWLSKLFDPGKGFDVETVNVIELRDEGSAGQCACPWSAATFSDARTVSPSFQLS